MQNRDLNFSINLKYKFCVIALIWIPRNLATSVYIEFNYIQIKQDQMNANK